MTVQDRYPEYLPDQREFFDVKITEDWAQYRNERWDRTRRFEIARLFGIVRPRRILDVGCGCGFHDAEMARYPFVEAVEAIDYSARSVEKAQEVYPHAKVRRRVADIGELTAEEPYDLVVSFQVIEHTPDDLEFVRQCARCVRPGGAVAVFTVHRLRPYNRVRMRYGKPPEMEDPMHKREYVPADLARLGEVAGLKVKCQFSYAADAPRLPYGLALWAGWFRTAWATRLAAVWEKPEE
ncbi:MAG TPA: class I SAM-dependent methyltransferase [Candidatus Sumerlaeota bacterium]|nr:class I SAM-dependent methyltransferase [Candidatus Sumerlaeota bacterium]